MYCYHCKKELDLRGLVYGAKQSVGYCWEKDQLVDVFVQEGYCPFCLERMDIKYLLGDEVGEEEVINEEDFEKLELPDGLVWWFPREKEIVFKIK